MFHQTIPLVRKCGDGIGNRVVQAAVEGSKLVYRDRRLVHECEIRYGLAQVSIVVNNLVDGEAML